MDGLNDGKVEMHITYRYILYVSRLGTTVLYCTVLFGAVPAWALVLLTSSSSTPLRRISFEVNLQLH